MTETSQHLALPAEQFLWLVYERLRIKGMQLPVGALIDMLQAILLMQHDGRFGTEPDWRWVCIAMWAKNADNRLLIEQIWEETMRSFDEISSVSSDTMIGDGVDAPEDTMLPPMVEHNSSGPSWATLLPTPLMLGEGEQLAFPSQGLSNVMSESDPVIGIPSTVPKLSDRRPDRLWRQAFRKLKYGQKHVSGRQPNWRKWMAKYGKDRIWSEIPFYPRFVLHLQVALIVDCGRSMRTLQPFVERYCQGVEALQPRVAMLRYFCDGYPMEGLYTDAQLLSETPMADCYRQWHAMPTVVLYVSDFGDAEPIGDPHRGFWTLRFVQTLVKAGVAIALLNPIELQQEHAQPWHIAQLVKHLGESCLYATADPRRFGLVVDWLNSRTKNAIQ